MVIEINDYFEIDNEKYLVLHKNKDEITVAVQANTDIKILLKHKNFFNHISLKEETLNPFYDIQNLASLLENLSNNHKIIFLGYTKYFNEKQKTEKRKSHYTYHIFLKIGNDYFSLMITEQPACYILTDYYYTEGWGYKLDKKEIISLYSINEITNETVFFSKEYIIVKEELDMKKEKDFICFNDILKIHTDLSDIQVEELKKNLKVNRNAYHLDNKQDFVNGF